VTAPVPLTCPKCQAALPLEADPAPAQACPSCARPIERLVFPAYYRPPAIGKAAQTLLTTEDASCFYHPQSRAQVPCDLCGRFLCALCDVELQGKHLCPSCLDAGGKKKRIRNLENERVLYGGTASLLALLPMILFWPLTIITGPIAVFLAIYGWRKPRSLVRPGTFSFIVAILFGLAQTILWILVIAGATKVL